MTARRDRKPVLSLSLQNSWEHVKGEWWKWAAFIDDGGTGDLKKVERVEYVLHPTFDDPVRNITDAADGFKMETAGWGTFPLTAFVYTKDGDKLKLTRDLRLERGTGRTT